MAQLSRLTPCRGCGKEIAFIKTKNGKSIPVDPEARYFLPGQGGGYTYILMDGETMRGKPTEESPYVPYKIGYISHFATCPAADSFRKKQKSERTKGGK